MYILRIILIPFSFLYGCIGAVRNYLYNAGLLHSKEFGIPVICVGNLSAGGTGKTPQIEYLIRLISPLYSVATLSRGYGRLSSGFRYAAQDSISTEVGDEPRQFKTRFPTIPVAVDEKRVHGIQQLLTDYPQLGIVLLDDAFQHRQVKPSLSIVLTDFESLYYKDRTLPSGTLREFQSGIHRAHIIVITKCPTTISPIEKRCIIGDIRPRPYQRVFFSTIRYGELVGINPNKENKKLPVIDQQCTVMVVCGIANPTPLLNHIGTKTNKTIPLCFGDHHEYTMVELENIKRQFESIPNHNKIIVTTEKDAMRLYKDGLNDIVALLPIFYIPIQTDFLFKEGDIFDAQIIEHIEKTMHKNGESARIRRA